MVELAVPQNLAFSASKGSFSIVSNVSKSMNFNKRLDISPMRKLEEIKSNNFILSNNGEI